MISADHVIGRNRHIISISIIGLAILYSWVSRSSYRILKRYGHQTVDPVHFTLGCPIPPRTRELRTICSVSGNSPRSRGRDRNADLVHTNVFCVFPVRVRMAPLVRTADAICATLVYCSQAIRQFRDIRPRGHGLRYDGLVWRVGIVFTQMVSRWSAFSRGCAHHGNLPLLPGCSNKVFRSSTHFSSPRKKRADENFFRSQDAICLCVWEHFSHVSCVSPPQSVSPPQCLSLSTTTHNCTFAFRHEWQRKASQQIR